MRRLVALLAVLLLAGCVREVDPSDGDGDGVPDSYETTERTFCFASVDGQSCVKFTSDPTKKDTDGDGLLDNFETGTFSNPDDVDSDDDGLLDGADVAVAQAGGLKLAGAKLVVVNDVYLGEASQCEGQGTKPAKADSDILRADGIPDGDEVRGWNVTVRGETRRVVTDPCSADSDGDTLDDGAEKTAGSDPLVADTDGDGVKDGLDADPLADLGVRVTVQKLRLEGTRGATGSNVEFQFFASASATPQTKSTNVPPGGAEQSPNLVFTGNVDDSAASRTSAPTQVVLGARDAGTKAGIDLGIPSTISYDLKSDTETLVYDGADGTTRILIETIRV